MSKWWVLSLAVRLAYKLGPRFWLAVAVLGLALVEWFRYGLGF